MRTFFAILYTVAAFAVATPLFAGEENPCGNHGDHCCTDNDGQSYLSVEDECNSFCTSTAQAVSVSVSECEARSAATCAQTCGIQVAAAVAKANAECAQTCTQTCSAPACLNARKKTRTIAGVQYTVSICRQTTEK